MQILQSRRWAFLVCAIWLGLAGLSLLFPAIGSQVFSMQIINVGLSSEMGGIMISLALVALVCSSDTKRYEAIWLPFAFGLGFNALINVFYLVNGHYTLSNAIFNIILNPLLALWLWQSRSTEF